MDLGRLLQSNFHSLLHFNDKHSSKDISVPYAKGENWKKDHATNIQKPPATRNLIGFLNGRVIMSNTTPTNRVPKYNAGK